MRFQLIDQVKEQSANHIVVVKRVTAGEEYLADHFPGFPVLPGVMMIETVIQAARQMLADRSKGPLVLGEAKAIKFGQMVRPGHALEVHVKLVKELPDGGYACRGTAWVREVDSVDGDDPDATAVSGRFTMRPVRMTVQT